MTHELKTPLNGIISLLELSETCENLNKLKYYIDIVKKNSLLLFHMINNLIDYNKILKNNLDLKISRFDITKTIKNLTGIL